MRRCAKNDGPGSMATALQLEDGAMDLLHVDAGIDGNLLELRQRQRTDISWNPWVSLLKLCCPAEDLLYLFFAETFGSLDGFTHRAPP